MSDDLRNRVARALCAEECAAFGDPPCWRVVDDWGPDNCCGDDGPNCFHRADSALAEIGEPAPVSVREAAFTEAADRVEKIAWIEGTGSARDRDVFTRAIEMAAERLRAIAEEKDDE